MKRITKTAALLCFAVIFCALAAVLLFVLKPQTANVLLNYKTDSYDEATQQAKNIDNLASLVDGEDFDFSKAATNKAQKKKLGAAASFIKDSDLGGTLIYIKDFTESGTKSKKQLTESQLDGLKAVFDKLEKNSLEACFAFDFSKSNSLILDLCKSFNVKAVLLLAGDETGKEESNEKIQQLRQLFQKSNLQTELWLQTDTQKGEILNSSSADRLFITVPDYESETEILSFFETLKLNGENLSKAVFYYNVSACSKDGLSADSVLKQVCQSNKYDFTSLRVFGSLSSLKADYENTFSAVQKYISGEKTASALLQKLEIENYGGETVETEVYSAKIKLCASPAFDVYSDGKKIETDENGEAEIELNFKTGENSFTFSQCGNEVIYKTNVTFSGDLIRSAQPGGDISAYPGQKTKITISAVSDAVVSVRVGSQSYSAKQKSEEDSGYSTYTAEITFPQSEAEITSIGKIVVTAVWGEKSFSFDAAQVFYRQKEETTASVSAAASQTQTTLAAENFVPSAGDVSTETNAQTTFEASAASAASTESAVLEDVSNQLCVVTSSQADTWPSSSTDDKFVPYSSALAEGTMDYITGTSESYDSDKKSTRYFYTLSCGKKIQTSSVKVLAKTDMGDNSISVLSSSAENGDLKIVLAESWKAAYSFSFSPQEYYKANGKLYNVKSFTAQTISFTFYHTVSVSGSVDTSGSDVVSSASWSSDSASKTVTLTLPLISQGKFYGFSANYDASGNLVLTINSRSKTLSGAVILLDPGHGGKDSGALGLSGAVYESNINLSVAAMVKSLLEQKGATVYLTRTSDQKVSLEERKSLAYSLKPDIFVSIHSDASESSSETYGTSSYYYKPMSKALSDSIHSEIVSAYKNYIYASQAEMQKSVDRGSKFNPFSVIRLEDCPAVLLEIGFVSNDTECNALLNEANREKIAAAIANGIENYFSNY